MSWENEKPTWLKIKEGEEKEFVVHTITEKKATGKINPLPNRDYYYEFDTSEGKLTVNNVGLFFALTGNGVREGDRVRVKYVKKGGLGRPSLFEVQMIKKADYPSDLDENEKIRYTYLNSLKLLG